MQQIHFIVGDERRFFDFIKRLDGRISMNEMLKKLKTYMVIILNIFYENFYNK